MPFQLVNAAKAFLRVTLAFDITAGLLLLPEVWISEMTGKDIRPNCLSPHVNNIVTAPV